jgi:translocator protein
MTYKQRSTVILMALMLICLAAGAIGGVVTAGSVTTWYPTLVKPSWNPPTWLFGPVWTALYLMMAVAMWLVWKSDPKFQTIKTPALLFGAQLLLNVAWPFLFFGAKSPGLAVIIILALWLTIAATIFAFALHSRVASFLLVPYIAWVSFASALNISIWQLNP